MKNLIPIGQITSLVSFILGSILLFSYMITKNTDLINIGIYYLFIAFIINSLLLLSILIASIIESHLRMKLLKTCGIMLLNMPIAFGYFLIVLTITK